MKVILSPIAVKQLKRLPMRERKKVDRKLQLLAVSPFVGKALERDLKGSYSLKAWPYRIIYDVVRSRNTVSVLVIGHRQGVYK